MGDEIIHKVYLVPEAQPRGHALIFLKSAWECYFHNYRKQINYQLNFQIKKNTIHCSVLHFFCFSSPHHICVNSIGIFHLCVGQKVSKIKKSLIFLKEIVRVTYVPCGTCLCNLINFLMFYGYCLFLNWQQRTSIFIIINMYLCV